MKCFHSGKSAFETIKRVLEPQLKSLEISDITTNRTDIIAYPSAEIFCQKITAAEEQDISLGYNPK